MAISQHLSVFFNVEFLRAALVDLYSGFALHVTSQILSMTIQLMYKKHIVGVMSRQGVGKW